MTADFKQGANLLGSILASGQIAGTSNTTIYTVPASSCAKIATAVLCNTSGSAVTISVSQVPSGGAVDGTHKVVSGYSLAAGDSMSITEIVGSLMGAADYLSIIASTGAVIDYTVTGVVSS